MSKLQLMSSVARMQSKKLNERMNETLNEIEVDNFKLVKENRKKCFSLEKHTELRYSKGEGSGMPGNRTVCDHSGQ